MAEHDDIKKVKRQIKKIYNRKKRAALAVCLLYAARAKERILQLQGMNRFWTNQTGVAKNLIFEGVIKTKKEFGWFVAHGVEYGIYLELANDRKHAVLLPTIVRFYNRFIEAVEKIYGPNK